jgi:hypothetical protein
MKYLKDKLHYLFATNKGLILINMAILSLVSALFGTLSGPLKEWGIGDLTVKFLGMDMQPQDREGRIVILYHAIAVTFTSLLVYLIIEAIPLEKRIAKRIRSSITVGYLLTVIFGLGFAYWGHNWAFHGLFIAGLTIVFYSGVLLSVALWPKKKEYLESNKDYSRTKKGVSLERTAFFIMAVAMLGSAVFGAVAGSNFGNGFETFLAEDGVRHVHHTKLELAIIGHLHIMLTLIGICTTLLIGRWFNWKGITHKIGIPSLIWGTIIITIGVWAVVPYQLYAHTIIYVGAVFSMFGALMLVIFGWGKLIKEGTKDITKPNFFQKIRALLSDSLRFGPLWQMVFMNFCVSGIGIFMAVKLEEIFREIPFREERITLTGHWHILSVLTATIVLMYIVSKIYPINKKAGNIFGWIIILASDLAFAMITIFSIKRLWVIEEAQHIMVKKLNLFSEIGLGLLLTSLGVYMVIRLVDFLKNGKIKAEIGE